MDSPARIPLKRHGRKWWKRKRFWIVLFAILGGILLTLYLIMSMENRQQIDQ